MFYETYHVHTVFSDGDNTVDETVAAAIEQGVRILGFSDHSYNLPSVSYCMTDPAAYRAAVEAAKVQFADKMAILCGIEQEWISEKPQGYDFVIGAVHLIKTPDGYKDVDDTAQMQRQTADAFFGGDFYAYTKAYFDTVATLNKTVDPTFIAHFDLVAKFNEQVHFFDETDPRYTRPAIEAIHTLCEKKGTVFEINTGALPRGARRTPYPTVPFLKEIQKAGGKIIFSSDSHRNDTLLFGGAAMADAAKAAGFTSRIIIRADGSLEEIGI